MYLSTTENIPGHRITKVGGPVWGVGDYYADNMNVSSEAVVTSAIEKAANSLCRSLQEIGYNGAIGLTQTTGLTNICAGWSKKGYYVLMGTAVMVE